MPRKPISFELDFMIKDIFPRFAVKQFDDVLDSLRYAIYSESKRNGKMFDRNKYNV